jgi:hypothetical protein|tara:strand:- start:215 stop:427 length:213 start_codon:yes stop_codon:yes gene_type:complete
MERTVTTIEFDFTNHFGTPFTFKPNEQWYIDDVKRQVWTATTEADVKDQIEMLYGFEVKNLVTDIVLEAK